MDGVEHELYHARECALLNAFEGFQDIHASTDIMLLVHMVALVVSTERASIANICCTDAKHFTGKLRMLHLGKGGAL